MTVAVFGYLSLISIDFTILFFHFLLSFMLISIEKMYLTLKRVFNHISKHLEVRQKYSSTRHIFKLFLVFGNVVKHGLSYLIYHLKNPEKL